MRVHVVQQADHVLPGGVQDWAQARGHETIVWKPYENGGLPEADGLVVLLGGPQDAWDDDGHPHLADQRRLTLDCLRNGVPALGLCLGIQIMALALGASVGRATTERGFWPVERVGEHDLLPATFEPFLSHNDACELPPEAELLARSEATPVQAFRQASLLGLQFHLETTPASLPTILDRRDWPEAEFTQTNAEILAQADKAAKTVPILYGVLDSLAAASAAF